MVTVLKQGATKERIKNILEKVKKASNSKGIDAYKYLGKIKLKKDALTIQKELRDEWK